jgi:hypothetical protein
MPGHTCNYTSGAMTPVSTDVPSFASLKDSA